MLAKRTFGEKRKRFTLVLGTDHNRLDKQKKALIQICAFAPIQKETAH